MESAQEFHVSGQKESADVAGRLGNEDEFTLAPVDIPESAFAEETVFLQLDADFFFPLGDRHRAIEFNGISGVQMHRKAQPGKIPA